MVPAIDLELNWDFPSPHVLKGDVLQFAGGKHLRYLRKSHNETAMLANPHLQ
jgi:hypothetical protein